MYSLWFINSTSMIYPIDMLAHVQNDMGLFTAAEDDKQLVSPVDQSAKQASI